MNLMKSSQDENNSTLEKKNFMRTAYKNYFESRVT